MSKKLDHKQLGPFPIIEKVSSHAFRLGLTPAMSKLHNVFHVSLLELTNKSSIPNRRQDPPPPVEIAGEDEYEVDRIVNSERRRGRVLYLVQWKGYEDRPDFQTWETLIIWQTHRPQSRRFTEHTLISPNPKNIFPHISCSDFLFFLERHFLGIVLL